MYVCCFAFRFLYQNRVKLFHPPSVGVNRGRYIGLISAEIEFLSLHGDTQVSDYRGLTLNLELGPNTLTDSVNLFMRHIVMAPNVTYGRFRV